MVISGFELDSLASPVWEPEADCATSGMRDVHAAVQPNMAALNATDVPLRVSCSGCRPTSTRRR